MLKSFKEWLLEQDLSEDENLKWIHTKSGHSIGFDEKSGKIKKGLFVGKNIKDLDQLFKGLGSKAD